MATASNTAETAAAGYRDDVLLAGLAFLESAAHLPEEDRLECGLGGLGIPWSSSMILGRRASGLERRALRLAARDLAAAGLVKLRRDASYSGRMTHFQLTADGFRRAVELADGQAAIDLVADVLDETEWGEALATIAREITTAATH